MAENANNNQNKESKKLGFFEQTGKSIQEFADRIGEGTKQTLEKAAPIVDELTQKSKEAISDLSDLSKESVKVTMQKADEIKRDGFFKGKSRKQAVNNYNDLLANYEEIQEELSANISSLYTLRLEAMLTLKDVEIFINNLANSPKEFKAKLKVIDIEISNFDHKRQEVFAAEQEAERAEKGVSAGASLSALGVAVAALGPTAAMGIATTFGTASTGVAISTLSGAAATNAALAWLGGGALVAGGGGVASGTGFLALAGPVGWTVAGAMLALSAGAGYQANKNNEKIVEDLKIDSQKILHVTAEMKRVLKELKGIQGAIEKEMDVINTLRSLLVVADYQDFSNEEKMQAGMIVNSTLTLAQMINKEVSVQLEQDDE